MHLNWVHSIMHLVDPIKVHVSYMCVCVCGYVCVCVCKCVEWAIQCVYVVYVLWFASEESPDACVLNMACTSRFLKLAQYLISKKDVKGYCWSCDKQPIAVQESGHVTVR